jgi:arsenate reductase
MIIYHNPRCRKSRETLEIIEKAGKDVQVIEYLKETPSAEELRELINKLGISAEALLRKNEAAYKEKYKGKELSEKEWIAAMVQNPKLIERPIVVKNDKAVICRPPERVRKLL